MVAFSPSPGLVILVVALTILPLRSSAQEEQGEVVVISEQVGEEIDKEEKNNFGLFPNIKGFQSAVCFKLADDKYVLKITYLDEQSGESNIERIQVSEESINNIRYQIDVKPWEIFDEMQEGKSMRLQTKF